MLSALVLVSMFLGGCPRPHPSAGDKAAPQVLRISQRNEPADLDPATASLPDDFFIIRALSEGLLVPTPNGGPPHPGAAARMTVSNDGLTYTFFLRADGRWSNGEPLTAGDFIRSFRRTLSPETAAPKADLFFAVKNARAFATGALKDFSAVGFRAPDERTLVVSLDRPSLIFPLQVASPAWLPVNPRVVAQHGRNWTQPANYVGNGPFRLVEWRSQQRIVVRKNPAYHAAAGIHLDEIQFVRFDNADSEERAFRAGQIDITMAVPTTKIAGYARDRPNQLVQTPLAETRYLTFNVNRPPLTDPRVRRALSLAIDRERIVTRVTLGGQQPAGRVLPPPLRTTPDFNALTGEHEFDPDRARALLAQAGFARGQNFPRLEVTAWSPSQAPVLEAIQEMWRKELGIEVTVAIRELKVHIPALRAGDYDVGFVTTLLDILDPLPLLAEFTSDATGNLPHWRDSAFDEIMRTAATRLDPSRRQADLNAAEARLLDAAAVAPVYFNVRNSLVSPRVKGWVDDPLWTRFYAGVSIDSGAR